jgi:hypothetical protein
VPSAYSAWDKFALAGYWALLTTCTPAWHRNAVQLAERQLAELIPLVARHMANEKPQYEDFIEQALAEGRIEPNPDGQHIKAMLTQQLTRTTLLLYQLDWTIIQNRTLTPFITSDNPSSVCRVVHFRIPSSVFCRWRRTWRFSP